MSNNSIPKELLQYGACEVEKPPSRLICAVDAMDKDGKSNFACTAPSPIIYLNADKAAEDVAHKFVMKGKRIIQVPLRKDYSFSTKFTKESALELVTNYEGVYRASLALPDDVCKTIVIDTASDVYDWYTTGLLPAGALPSDYGRFVYPAWVRMVFEAYDYNKNVIFLHKLKDEVENVVGGPFSSKKTGFKKRAGYRDMAYAVQVNVLLTRPLTKDGTKPGKFMARIYNSSHNPDAAGEEFFGDDVSFQSIANTVMLDSSPSDWKCVGKECKRCYPVKKEKKPKEDKEDSND